MPRPFARPIVLPGPDHYTFAEELEFVDLLPPLDGGVMRIRLKVGAVNILDLPLSDNILVALFQRLTPDEARDIAAKLLTKAASA